MTNLSLKMLFCCCFFTVSLSAAAQNIELDCPCGFAIQGASVTLTADAVINPRNGGRSGTLKLKLWATSSPYSGGSISGHIVGEYRFSDALNGRFRYTDLDLTVAYDRPPDGIYYMTMVVTEFNNGQDFIQDYITFDRTLTVGNGGTGAGGGGSNTASIELDCPCGFTISGASVNLRADAVVNPRNGGHSGTLKLKLWATSSPYSGGNIRGHIVGEYRFSDALNGGIRYTDLDLTVAYDRPPDGTYYMTMVVTEFNNGQDFIQDYLTFGRTLTVGNGGTGAGGGGSNTVNICDRTPGVVASILSEINPTPTCGAVPEVDLAGISYLGLSEEITSLASGDFTGLSALLELDLSSLYLASLPAGVFDGLSALEGLNLSHNDFTTLPAGVFDGLSALEFLDLSHNDFTTLPAGVFDGLSALEELDLSGLGLTSLPAGVFDGLSALEYLYLLDNDFTTLPAGVFDGLSALEYLYLLDNDFTTLPAGVFDGLSALPELNLSGLGLTSLPAGVFDGLSALEFLDLSHNELTSLPAGVFDGLSALWRLDLESNNLTTLPAGVFDGLSALWRLDLESNNLTTLPAGVFDGLSELQELDLESNNLTTLPAGVFDGLSELQELDLHSNELTTLPAGVFDGLSALEVLYLDDNALTTLPAGVFDGLSALRTLWLGDNPFTILPVGVFDDVLDTLASIGPGIETRSVPGVFGGATSVSVLIPAFVVDSVVRSAHFVCSRVDADAIVATTAGVDDCLRITSTQFNAAIGSELDGGTESLGTPASYSFSNSQLTIPAVEVQSEFGSVYYEVILGLHNLSPLQFTIAEATELDGPGSALVSTYNNGLLTIPVVVVDDTRFYLELIINEVQGVIVFELMYAEEILN